VRVVGLRHARGSASRVYRHGEGVRRLVRADVCMV